jgi:hypothetical protein
MQVRLEGKSDTLLRDQKEVTIMARHDGSGRWLKNNHTKKFLTQANVAIHILVMLKNK